MNDETVGAVHWSFWAIGVVALIWNAMGCMNFVMQMDADSLAGYSSAARALVEGRPAWSTGAFAVAVFGGALGSVLLLLRKSIGYYLFVASLIGVIVTTTQSHVMADSTTALPMEIWMGSLLSLVVAVSLIGYSKLTERRGWTR